MADWETFDQIRALPDGPVKKFQLIKTFGTAIKDYGIDDPRLMSCRELEDLIAFLLEA